MAAKKLLLSIVTALAMTLPAYGQGGGSGGGVGSGAAAGTGGGRAHRLPRPEARPPEARRLTISLCNSPIRLSRTKRMPRQAVRTPSRPLPEAGRLARRALASDTPRTASRSVHLAQA